MKSGLAVSALPASVSARTSVAVRIISLRREEYEAMRAHPKRFVMVPGHQEADDRLVLEAADFIVIEKRGKEGDLVAARDPRSACRLAVRLNVSEPFSLGTGESSKSF